MRGKYWIRIKELAEDLHSDGCTGVSQFRAKACLEHDVHYRTGRWWFVSRLTGRLSPGEPITRKEADHRFRVVLQRMSRFGRWSPMAWWRWAGVRILPFTKRAWKNYRKSEPFRELVSERGFMDVGAGGRDSS